MANDKKEFFVLRFAKKIFIAGLINILPTILVIGIIIIFYNFLNDNLGGPINVLIKKQLEGNWKEMAVRYLGVDRGYYEPLNRETYDQLVKRVQDSSVQYNEAKSRLEKARKQFEKDAEPMVKKKTESTDPDYIKFLDQQIEKIRDSVNLESCQHEFDRESRALRNEISKENEIRLATLKWGNDRPEKLKAEIDKKYPDIIGLVMAFLIIFIVGILITTFVGRSITHYIERTISSLPIVRKIYPYTKQLTEFLFKEKEMKSFKSVVAVEYPKKGIYSIGFPTGGEVRLETPEGTVKKIIVFVPSSPTPFTGWTIMVGHEDIIPLNMTVEEAVRFVVTGGVVMPGTPFKTIADDQQKENIRREEEPCRIS